jgi:hypothetical protein
MHADELISDREKFLLLKKQCEQIIDTGKRLPDLVFRRPFARYFAVEYTHVYAPKFGTLLHEMSRLFGDETVSYRMLDPDPWKGSFFGLVSFASASLPRRYSELMATPFKKPAILAGANLGVFWGSSLDWGVFADRISWELAVIAMQKDVDVSKILGWPCFNAEQVTSYMRSQYHMKDPSDSIAAEFNSRFLANYSI